MGRLLEWTTAYFRDRRVDSPRLDAEVLLAHILDCPRIELYTIYDGEVSASDRGGYRDLVRKRSAGQPVAYLVGHREFYSLHFDVTPAVLIPRPETELLVSEALNRMPADAPSTFLDVGTGSGAIAVTLAVHRPLAVGVAVDLSPEALAVAKSNADRHDVAGRVSFVRSDLCQSLEPTSTFDVVTSNPPYVRTAEWPELSRDVRDYEPRIALDGGDDGLTIIHRLVDEAAPRIKPGGWFLMEFGVDHESPIRERLLRDPRFEHVQFIADVSRRPRLMLAQRSSR